VSVTPSATVPNSDAPGSTAAGIFLCVLGPIFFLIQPLYVGTLTDQLGFDPQQVGWISGAEFGGTVVVSIAGFFLIHRLNWRLVIAAALTVQAIGNFASGYFTSFTELLILRLTTATFGMAPLYIVAIAILSNTSRVSRNFSLVVFGQMLLAIASLALLPDFIPHHGLATLFVPFACLGLIALPLLYLVPEGAKGRTGAPQPTRPEDSNATTSIVPAAGVLVVQVIWYAGIGGVWAFIERVGVAGGLAAGDVADALAVGMGVGLIGALSAGYLTERLGRIPPFLTGMLFQVVAIAILLNTVTPGSFLLSVCIYNFMWNLCLPPLFDLIVATDPKNRFSVLLPTFQSLGIIIGSVVGGTLVKNFGLPALLAAGIGLTLLSLAIYILIARQYERPAAQAT